MKCDLPSVREGRSSPRDPPSEAKYFGSAKIISLKESPKIKSSDDIPATLGTFRFKWSSRSEASQGHTVSH
jgi:hypothetical protein